MPRKYLWLLLPLSCGCSSEISGPWPLTEAEGAPSGSAGMGSVPSSPLPGEPLPGGPPAASSTPTTPIAPTSPGTGSGGPPPPAGGEVLPSGTDLQGSPEYTRFSRLTNSQWANSVKTLLGMSVAPSTDPLEDPVGTTTDFLNNERLLDVTSTQRDAYERLTELAVQELTSEAELGRVYDGNDAEDFIRTMGRRVYRRPLSDTEVGNYQELFDVGAGLSGEASEFVKGAGLVIQTMLQSPHFIYRIEAGEPGEPLDGYEVAARLSLWLLDTAPSEELLDQAETLTTPDAVAAVAEDMLEQPAAAQVMSTFFYEWMGLKRFNDVNKDPSLPLPEGYAEELKTLSTKYFERIYSEDLGLKEILTGTQGYVGPKTAAFYGMETSSVELQDFGAARTGWFAQVPYTLLYGSYAGQSDIIHRGAHLQRQLLCGVLDAPPAVFALPELQPDQSNRERVHTMTAGDACSGCHVNYINPLGFAFENFDGLGRIRSDDNGDPVDTTGSYPFPESTVDFTDHASLMQAAYESEMAHICYAKRIAGFGLGRDIVANDQALLDSLASVSRDDGSTKDLILELVKSPAFLLRSEGSEQ
jgi:Protein of unknown function (DUF1592)/Protein of unknown function (DUF1588)/Protein of unknown function (DUF1595)/Protein of unknown function (DUF1585)/Protein of unknown function (DUF1587)